MQKNGTEEIGRKALKFFFQKLVYEYTKVRKIIFYFYFDSPWESFEARASVSAVAASATACLLSTLAISVSRPVQDGCPSSLFRRFRQRCARGRKGALVSFGVTVDPVTGSVAHRIRASLCAVLFFTPHRLAHFPGQDTAAGVSHSYVVAAVTIFILRRQVIFVLYTRRNYVHQAYSKYIAIRPRHRDIYIPKFFFFYDFATIVYVL